MKFLRDGNKFVRRLKEGVTDNREYSQLINIATDGESYGHTQNSVIWHFLMYLEFELEEGLFL